MSPSGAAGGTGCFHTSSLAAALAIFTLGLVVGGVARGHVDAFSPSIAGPLFGFADSTPTAPASAASKSRGGAPVDTAASPSVVPTARATAPASSPARAPSATLTARAPGKPSPAAPPAAPPACNVTALLASARAGTLRWRVSGNATVGIDAASARCDPAALSRDRVLEALRGQHVAFIGDSLTRYQYLSLVYFLETGRWTSPAGAPVNTHESTWASWAAFHEGTAGRLRGHEICDCYRAQKWDPSTVREMRYYLSPCGRVRVSYVMWFYNINVAGHDPAALNVGCLDAAFRAAASAAPSTAATKAPWTCPQTLCQPGACGGGAWAGDARTAVPAHVRALRPSTAVVNTGHWGPDVRGGPAHFGRVLEVVDRLAADATAAPPAGGGTPLRIVWKSTTPTRYDANPRDALADAVVAHRLGAAGGRGAAELFDARALLMGLVTPVAAGAPEPEVPAPVTQAAYWDSAHFAEPVYSLLNAALLAQLAGGAV